MNRILLTITIVLGHAAVLLYPGGLLAGGGDGHGVHGEGAHEDETPKGPHGGRLLEQDGFSLEITLYETGLPPEFRVYAYRDGEPLDPAQVELEMRLERTGGVTDKIGFAPRQDFLRGDTVVTEPHSFRVYVDATHDGRKYEWRYDQFEGRTTIPADMADEMGIETAVAGPVSLVESRTLTGRVHTDPNRVSRVRARFPGVIQALQKELGERVQAGDRLATVQSNESLQEYAVRAPIDGLIVKRDAQVGEATGGEPLFVLIDLTEVWVELDVFLRDREWIRPGRPVVVETLDGAHRASSVIDWVSPLAAHASQSVSARVIVDNADGTWQPGQFIRARVNVAEREVPLAVRRSALQRFRDFQVVYARFGDTYEVRMLELGRRNRDWIEVQGGLAPGTEYVVENSYLVKADIEKSGASHDH